MEFREKRKFFTLRPPAQKRREISGWDQRVRDIGMGPTGEMMLTYRATNALLTKSGCGAVLTVFCLPEVGGEISSDLYGLSGCDILNLTFCRLDFHQLLIKIS